MSLSVIQKNTFFHAALGAIFLWGSLFPQGALAGGLPCQGGLQERNGLCLPTKDAVGINDGVGFTVENAIENIILFLTSFLAVLAMLVIIVSGILYMTAAGDQGRVDTAKRWLIYGIVGLVVALLAWVIVVTVVTMFGVGGPPAVA